MNLRREKVYFGWQLWRFPSMTDRPCCCGPWVREAAHRKRLTSWAQTAHFMAEQWRRGRGNVRGPVHSGGHVNTIAGVWEGEDACRSVCCLQAPASDPSFFFSVQLSRLKADTSAQCVLCDTVFTSSAGLLLRPGALLPSWPQLPPRAVTTTQHAP